MKNVIWTCFFIYVNRLMVIHVKISVKFTYTIGKSSDGVVICYCTHSSPQLYK